MKFAAIDVGSNAVRLLLSRVIEDGRQPIIKKESLVRIPIRLGEDAFTNQKISDDKIDMLLNTMTGFKYLIDAYRALDYTACATSAMREAENGREIAAEIKKRSGIQLEIVAGKTEADIIYSNHFAERLHKDKPYLYVDVGGGSTELTLFTQNSSLTSNSFDIGTVRVLQNRVGEERWRKMKQWVKAVASEFPGVVGIGSGGNINKLFKMSRIKEGRPITYKKVKSLYHYLKAYSVEERIKILGMRPDRADVIIPACRIFTSVMKWAQIKKMYVPQIGLSDGLIHLLYEKHLKK